MVKSRRIASSWRRRDVVAANEDVLVDFAVESLRAPPSGAPPERRHSMILPPPKRTCARRKRRPMMRQLQTARGRLRRALVADVEVFRLAVEEEIANAAADEVCLIAAPLEPPDDLRASASILSSGRATSWRTRRVSAWRSRCSLAAPQPRRPAARRSRAGSSSTVKDGKIRRGGKLSSDGRIARDPPIAAEGVDRLWNFEGLDVCL